MRKINLIGLKFSRLLVLEEDLQSKRVRWMCRCDCGNIVSASSEKLRIGRTKSCGCLNKENNILKAKKMNKAITKYEPWELTARQIWKRNYVDDGYLSFDDFYRLSQMNCYYCESRPTNEQNVHLNDKRASDFAKKNGFFIYSGLDRVDNSLPHQIDNLVPLMWFRAAKFVIFQKIVGRLMNLGNGLFNFFLL